MASFGWGEQGIVNEEHKGRKKRDNGCMKPRKLAVNMQECFELETMDKVHAKR
jgi:hypothetical protein